MWDEQGNGRTLTYDGTRVRSREEAILANWLFYNGVEYRYEEHYKFETADEDHANTGRISTTPESIFTTSTSRSTREASLHPICRIHGRREVEAPVASGARHVVDRNNVAPDPYR